MGKRSKGWKLYSIIDQIQKNENELEISGLLIENYKNEKFHIGFPDPVEAIRFRMVQVNITTLILQE